MQAGRATGRRSETDGSRCEGGGRISTGEELCFRSLLPEICFHHADSLRGERAGGREASNMELCIAGIAGGLVKG